MCLLRWPLPTRSSPADTARDTIHYAGATRGVETRLLPPTGYDYTLFDVVGLQRSLSWRNLAFLPKLDQLDVAGSRISSADSPRSWSSTSADTQASR